MQETEFKFNSVKATQALSIFIKHDAPTVEYPNKYARLLKMLYIADRESLEETGEPITGDDVVAMKNGPVLRKTFNLIRGRLIDYPYWKRYIKRGENRTLRLKKDPGSEDLNYYEEKKLEEIAERYKDKSWKEMMDIVEDFEEYEKRYDKRKLGNDITNEDILDGVNASEKLEIVKKKALYK